MRKLKISRLVTVATIMLITAGAGTLTIVLRGNFLQRQKGMAIERLALATTELKNIQLAERVDRELEGWKQATPLATRQIRLMLDLPPDLTFLELRMLRRHAPTALKGSSAYSMALHGELEILIQEEVPKGALLALPRFLETSRKSLGEKMQCQRICKVQSEEHSSPAASASAVNRWKLKKEFEPEFLQVASPAL